VLSGAGVVPAGDLSTADVGKIRGPLADSYSEHQAVQTEASQILLDSPAGSTDTEGYHYGQPSAAISGGGGVLNVPDLPDRPQEQRA
jgi:hypothetical protein